MVTKPLPVAVAEGETWPAGPGGVDAGVGVVRIAVSAIRQPSPTTLDVKRRAEQRKGKRCIAYLIASLLILGFVRRYLHQFGQGNVHQRETSLETGQTLVDNRHQGRQVKTSILQGT